MQNVVRNANAARASRIDRMCRHGAECKAKEVSLNEAAAYVAMRPDSENLLVVLVQA